MALTNAFLLPHSPLLIPEIGRANTNFLAKTSAAYRTISEGLKAKKIETLIIISPHGSGQDDAFTINVASELKIKLKDFGFIAPKTIFTGDVLLSDQIKNAWRPDFPVELVSQPDLDYGSAIPAYLLKRGGADFKIIVIWPAVDMRPEEYFACGERLRTAIEASEKNIAVLASGDLSHRLKKKSPGGYSPKGAKFDNKLIEYLNEPETAKENLLKMDANLIKDAGECGLKPILMLLGILGETAWKPQVLAYQTDFGIGYLSLDFQI